MLKTLLSSTENGMWKTVWNAIVSFFNPDLSGYTNFEFSDGILNLQIIIFGLFGGILLASFYAIFVRTTLGKFIRELLAKEALSPEASILFAESKYRRHLFTRRALLHGTTLRRVVHCVEEEKWIERSKAAYAVYEEECEQAKKNKTRKPKFIEPKFTLALDCRHFYIPEKDKITAEMRFRTNGSSYSTFFFVLLGCLVGILLVFALLPQLVRFFDNVISIFSLKGNMMN